MKELYNNFVYVIFSKQCFMRTEILNAAMTIEILSLHQTIANPLTYSYISSKNVPMSKVLPSQESSNSFSIQIILSGLFVKSEIWKHSMNDELLNRSSSSSVGHTETWITQRVYCSKCAPHIFELCHPWNTHPNPCVAQ